ncbi:MAG: hypothetical protein NC548_53255 [Lachnospiraceae bacterium]|nr:hypothetical protein [Lachnospiraceae bacterium]MCM1234882.1 hypothetical protein [Ruminococcus flavefaciens]
MKIKVTAARRDDIIRRRDEYDAAAARNKAKEQDSSRRFREAQDEVFTAVENEIRRQLGDRVGNLVIRVESRWGHGLSVNIGNSTGSPRRDPNASLTWSWSAYLGKDGEVTKESSSWSGLEATTMDQIADLKICVDQLEAINTMDWKSLLDRSLPDWKDYMVRDLEDIGPRPNFDQELMEADIEDIVGQNVLVKMSEGRNYHGSVYCQIIRDSGSQYTVREVPASYVEQVNSGKPARGLSGPLNTIDDLVKEYGDTIRVRKTNFFNSLITPLQTIAF